MRSLIKKLFFRPLIFLNLLWLLIKPIFFKLRRYLFTAKRRIGRSAVCLIFIMGGFALPPALFAADKISDSKRLELLSLLAQDENAEVRKQAVKEAEEIGYKPETIQILSLLAQDESENVRLQVVNALWQLGHWLRGNSEQPDSLRILSGLAQDEDRRVRQKARNVLYLWGKGAAGNRLIAPYQLLFAPAMLRPERIDRFLNKMGYNLPPEIFEAEKISDPKLLQLLSLLAQDENVEVRKQAVWATAMKIGYKPEAIQILSLLAQDESENVRLQVVNAVEEIGYKPEAIQILSLLAQDESENIRFQVVNALWQLGSQRWGNAKQPESLRVLSRLAQDEDRRVRQKARNVLYLWGKGSFGNRLRTAGKLYFAPKALKPEIMEREIDTFLKKSGFMETNESKEKQ